MTAVNPRHPEPRSEMRSGVTTDGRFEAIGSLPPSIAVRRGNIALYDGHVELTRTFWAGLSNADPLRQLAGLPHLVDWLGPQV
jgi:prepilin-type processing-associated H-X9-DG protein